MNDISRLTNQVKAFRDQRDWKKYHTPKDLASDIVLESTEVLEHFQWKNGEELTSYLATHKDEIGDELSDVLHGVLLMADELGIDILTAFERKMKQNELKYPVSKCRGKNTKWTKL